MNENLPEKNRLKDLEVRRNIRKEKLRQIDDYIGFITAKSLGLGCTIAGGLEVLDPQFLTITLSQPGQIFAIGVALLVGKKFLEPFAQYAKFIKEFEND